MKVNWSEFTKQTLKEDFSSSSRACGLIGMIGCIADLEHYTDKEKLEAIKTVIKSYNEIEKELLELKD
ncbi:MAG: hypothetical protein QXI16_07850 [Sulfolobaceae archaeon]